MQKERARLTIYIDLDPIPGACHTVEWWIQRLQSDLPKWYNPTVSGFLVSEAPEVKDQLKQMATEIIAEAELIKMVDALADKGIFYGYIEQWAVDNNISFLEALEDLYEANK